MSSRVLEYVEATKAMLAIRDANAGANSREEDDALDALDDLWEAMSPAEIAEARTVLVALNTKRSLASLG